MGEKPQKFTVMHGILVKCTVPGDEDRLRREQEIKILKKKMLGL